MKATLEFNLPEEKKAYESAVQGAGYREVLREIFIWLEEQEAKGFKGISLGEVKDKVQSELRQNEVKIWG